MYKAAVFAPLNNITGRTARRCHVKDNQQEGLAPVEAVEETAAPPVSSMVGPELEPARRDLHLNSLDHRSLFSPQDLTWVPLTNVTWCCVGRRLIR